MWPAILPWCARWRPPARNLPICVSAVDPELFPAAMAAGAAMLEIGNFDSFYAQGRIFSCR